MMKRILFATDLDNTLLFSHRHRQPGDRCAELWNGAEQGFFTPETVDLLPQAARQVRLLPITTRSIAQYQRIRWPEGALPRASQYRRAAWAARFFSLLGRKWTLVLTRSSSQSRGSTVRSSARVMDCMTIRRSW